MRQRVERLPSLVDQHAQAQQRRSADAMLTVDQHAPAFIDAAPDELDPARQHRHGRGLEIGRRQVEEVDSCSAQSLWIVAIFLTKIDDGTDAVLLRKPQRMLDRKATADRDMIGQPVEIRHPLGCATSHRRFFIIFLHRIFFFIFRQACYCCWYSEYCCFCSHEGNNKASQLFRARMISHSKPEPIRHERR